MRVFFVEAFTFLVYITSLCSFIASLRLYNIGNKATNIAEVSKFAELRKFFLNLYSNVSLLDNRTTSAIILIIIERWWIWCRSVITYNTFFYISQVLRRKVTESKIIFSIWKIEQLLEKKLRMTCRFILEVVICNVFERSFKNKINVEIIVILCRRIYILRVISSKRWMKRYYGLRISLVVIRERRNFEIK